MKLLRRLHLFLGCFFAPLLTFYLVTGWYQTVNVDRRKGIGEAEALMDRLQSVHVDQIYPAASANSYSPVLYRALVILMCLALTITVVLGVVLAFKVLRPRWLLWLSLGLGVVVPVICLWLGQKQ